MKVLPYLFATTATAFLLFDDAKPIDPGPALEAQSARQRRASLPRLAMPALETGIDPVPSEAASSTSPTVTSAAAFVTASRVASNLSTVIDDTEPGNSSNQQGLEVVSTCTPKTICLDVLTCGSRTGWYVTSFALSLCSLLPGVMIRNRASVRGPDLHHLAQSWSRQQVQPFQHDIAEPAIHCHRIARFCAFCSWRMPFSIAFSVTTLFVQSAFS